MPQQVNAAGRGGRYAPSYLLAAAKVLDDIGVTYIHIGEADCVDVPEMPAAFKRRCA